MKATGPISADKLELSGESSMTGQPVSIRMNKTPDGIVFELTEGQNKMRDVYTRAR
jgi:hypothetical protein